MKGKHPNDSIPQQSAMLERKTDPRCACWDDETLELQQWRAEVMADGHGYCKHCQLKMAYYHGS